MALAVFPPSTSAFFSPAGRFVLPLGETFSEERVAALLARLSQVEERLRVQVHEPAPPIKSPAVIPRVFFDKLFYGNFRQEFNDIFQFSIGYRDTVLKDPTRGSACRVVALALQEEIASDQDAVMEKQKCVRSSWRPLSKPQATERLLGGY